MQIIETKRLILRSFAEGDAADLFAYLHAPTATCFLSKTLTDMTAAEIEVQKRALDAGSVAISLKETGQVIDDLFGGGAEEEEDAQTTSVGWNLNPEFGGQGYAFEAAGALLVHLFREREASARFTLMSKTTTPRRNASAKSSAFGGKACSSSSSPSPKTKPTIQFTETLCNMPS